MSTENFDAKLYQATVMLLSGRPPKPVDALIFISHAYGDYTHLYELAGDLFQRHLVDWIAIANNEGERVNSTEKYKANPGKTECIRILAEEQQILPSHILIPETPVFHTRQEADAFLKLAIQRGWSNAVILAQPHRILRVALGMVQAMEQAGYIMEIYTATPSSTPWREEAFGSQSIASQPRFKNIEAELERILLYQKSGGLPSIDDLLEYLEARDEGRLLLGPKGSNRFIK